MNSIDKPTEFVYPRDLSNFFIMSNDVHIYKAIKMGEREREEQDEQQ